MRENTVCPFYGKNDDYCDVGCDYISPYDVNQIIKFCNGRYCECLKYRELRDRIPVDALDMERCAV